MSLPRRGGGAGQEGNAGIDLQTDGGDAEVDARLESGVGSDARPAPELALSPIRIRTVISKQDACDNAGVLLYKLRLVI
jgi:hypothetical protein